MLFRLVDGRFDRFVSCEQPQDHIGGGTVEQIKSEILQSDRQKEKNECGVLLEFVCIAVSFSD